MRFINAAMVNNRIKKIKTLNPMAATAVAAATTEQIWHSKNPNSSQ